jgi:hypothetical protein
MMVQPDPVQEHGADACQVLPVSGQLRQDATRAGRESDTSP